MELKDVAGLGQPLKKLIAVIGQGVGALSRSYLVRRNADAEAYKIGTIGVAIAEAKGCGIDVAYKDETTELSLLRHPEVLALPDAEFEQRAVDRLRAQEAKRQYNIERITQHAAEELSGEQEVSPDELNADWIARFFRIAEDITTEQMQMLWGRVLAGEVKRPGSYSMRALDVLKNISQREAEVFVKLARLVFSDGEQFFVPNPGGGNYLQKNFAVTIDDILLLSEIGCIVEPNKLAFRRPRIKEAATELIYTCGSTCLLIRRQKALKEIRFPAIFFSEIGKQLIQLVDKRPADAKVLKIFASLFRDEGVSIKYGEVIEWLERGVKCDLLRDL